MSNLSLSRQLYRITGIWPHHVCIYHEALEHSSVKAQEGRFHGKDNERLEYLGDAILGAICADILFTHYPTKDEGFLTTARSHMVQRSTLGRIAHEIGLDSLIHASISHTSHNSFIAGNAFEALVGAIYVDRGYRHCYRFIKRKIIGKHIVLDDVTKEETNHKSRLIEWCQKRQYSCEFMLVSETMLNGSPLFTSEVLVCGIHAGRGTGYSKKESHQQAAQEAMNKIRKHQPVYYEILSAVSNNGADAANKDIETEASVSTFDTIDN